MYQCHHCDYKSRCTWCINRHSLKKHGIQRNHYGIVAPTNIQVPTSYKPEKQENRAPTTYKQATSMLEQYGNSPYVCRHCNFHQAYKWVVTKE